MKKILLTLVIWLVVASAIFYGVTTWLESLYWYAACTEAQVNQYFIQRGGYPVPYNSTTAQLYVAAACGVEHGVVPIQVTTGTK